MMEEYEYLLSPARLKICACLAVSGEASFTELKRETGLSDGNLSVQLAKLQAAGFVVPRKQTAEHKRTNTFWRLTDNGIEAFQEFLKWAKEIGNRAKHKDKVKE